MPVTVQALGGGQAKTLVTGGKGSVTVQGCGPVVVNAGQSGYYRVQYGPERFAGIVQNFAKLPAIDQLGVMSDAWSMGLAGYQPATCIAHRMSLLSPISPTLMGSPGMPWPVRVTIGKLARPFWCS